MHNYSSAHDKSGDLVGICKDASVEEMKSHAYLWTIYTMDERPSTLTDMYFAGI